LSKQCPKCKQRLRSRACLAKHLRDVHGISPEQCPECGKEFASEFSLRQHMLAVGHEDDLEVIEEW